MSWPPLDNFSWQPRQVQDQVDFEPFVEFTFVLLEVCVSVGFSSISVVEKKNIT